ncbi:MAG: ABC transporter permease [Clostridiales bacterium]|nr:ABC transporter permease [Clostridiales bacterium]
MKSFSKVFKFEFLNIVTNRVFIGLTVFIMLISAIVLFYPRYSSSVDLSSISSVIGNQKEKKLAIIDNTGEIADYLTDNLSDCNIQILDNKSNLKELVKTGKYDIAVNIKSETDYEYIVNDMGLFDSADSEINDLLLYRYQQKQLKALGLDDEKADSIVGAKINAEYVITGKNQVNSFFYTYILMFLLYLSVIIYGQMIAQSVATEKSSRAMELLITSADPKSLIFGKVLGTGFAGLSQISLILVWSALCFSLNSSAWKGNEIIHSIFDMPVSLIVYTILFFVLGFMIYAFLYGALGSLASKMEDISTLTMPLTFIMLISFMVPIFCMSSGSVDTPLMKVLSFIPFSSPLAMFARIAMSSVGFWEIAISVIILIVSVAVIGRLAVLIYRIGILMYGKPPKLNELLKLLRK